MFGPRRVLRGLRDVRGFVAGVSGSSTKRRRGWRRWERAGISPLKSGEIFDEAFSLYRTHGADLLKLIALPSALTFAFFILSWELVGRNLFVTDNPENVFQQATELIALVGIGFFVAAPVVLTTYSYMTALVSLYVSDVHLGRTPYLRAIHTRTLKLLPKLTALMLVFFMYSFAGILVGMVFLLASAIITDQYGGAQVVAPIASLLGILGVSMGIVILPFAFARYALAPVAMVNENLGVKDALRRARELVTSKGAPSSMTIWGLLFVIFSLQYLLWGGLSLPALGVLDFLQLQGVASSSLSLKALYYFLSVSGGYLAFLLVHPVLFSGLTYVYFDRRVRIEGYDIELLAQEIWRHDREIDFEL